MAVRGPLFGLYANDTSCGVGCERKVAERFREYQASIIQLLRIRLFFTLQAFRQCRSKVRGPRVACTHEFPDSSFGSGLKDSVDETIAEEETKPTQRK